MRQAKLTAKSRRSRAYSDTFQATLPARIFHALLQAHSPASRMDMRLGQGCLWIFSRLKTAVGKNIYFVFI
jgi:hypothetical protein